MITDLTKKKCVPCEGGTPPFTPEQIADYSKQVVGWEVVEAKRIQKTFKFAAGGSEKTTSPFVRALNWVNRLGVLAEKEGHHPDIAIHYNKIEVSLTTHAIGGLSENDFILAAKIDAIPADTGKITYDDFAKLEIKMGKIVTAERIEGSDKLLKLSVDLGEASESTMNPNDSIGQISPMGPIRRIRTICAGIAQYYKPEELIGKTIPVLSNLEPRMLRGVESNGMILAASDTRDGLRIPVLLVPHKEVPPGSPVQ